MNNTASMTDWSLLTPLRRVEENKSGRDFVVGDVHGCLNLLEYALQSVSFDPQCDRLFSVGDLIDRGEHSIELLQWLDKPWFYACLGNHEAILLDFTYGHDSELATTWSQYGGSWFLALTAQQQTLIAEAICRHCSFAIAIGNSAGQAQTAILHADIPPGMDWPTFCQQVGNDQATQHACLWSRARGKGLRDDWIDGVEQVVTGHQVVNEGHKRGNVWLLDTGAYRTAQGKGALTLLELPQTLHRFS